MHDMRICHIHSIACTRACMQASPLLLDLCKISGFEPLLVGWQNKESAGRKAAFLPGVVGHAVCDVLQRTFMLPDASLEDWDKMLSGMRKAWLYKSSTGHTWGGGEWMLAPTVRIQIQGVRKLVLFPVIKIAKFLQDNMSKPTYSYIDALNVLKNIKDEGEFKHLLDVCTTGSAPAKFCVKHVEMHAGEAMYTPPGYVLLEKTIAFSAGLRMSLPAPKAQGELKSVMTMVKDMEQIPEQRAVVSFCDKLAS